MCCPTVGQQRRRSVSSRRCTPPVLKPLVFYTLALDPRPSKAELCGLLWQDVDLNTGQVSIVRQLLKPSSPPLFGPPKNGMPRTITLTAKTVELLRRHRAHQAAIKLANRSIYQDYGLVFARD